jgi:hypothetical protein
MHWTRPVHMLGALKEGRKEGCKQGLRQGPWYAQSWSIMSMALLLCHIMSCNDNTGMHGTGASAYISMYCSHYGVLCNIFTWLPDSQSKTK